jgi:hypothetical protein
MSDSELAVVAPQTFPAPILIERAGPSTRKKFFGVLGFWEHRNVIQSSALCRVFLGQRRGAKRLESIQKGGRRDGGLKMDWTKPLARA